MACTYAPSTRKVETGAIWLGGERNVRGKRQELSGVWCGVWSLQDSGKQDLAHFWSEVDRGKSSLVAGCFAIPIFRLKPSICLWVFIIHTTSMHPWITYNLLNLCIYFGLGYF